MSAEGYFPVFAELKTALLPFRRELHSPSATETSRLRAAVGATRELIERDRLRTRAEAHTHGALRRGVQYLEERDLANLSAAEAILGAI